MCTHPPTNKQRLVRLHLLTNKWQLTTFRSLEILHVLAIGPFLPQYHSWSQVCFSADTYMANREWGSPMLMSPCNNREVGRETASPTFTILLILAYYYSLLWPASRTSFSHNPANVLGCHISSSQKLELCKRPMNLAAFCRLDSRDSVCAGVFVRCARLPMLSESVIVYLG